MNQPIHVLNQLGVLTSFSVAKRITEKDLKSFYAKEKRKGKTDKQINEQFKAKVTQEIQDAVNNNQIPGLIGPIEIAKEIGLDQRVIDNLPELNRLLLIVGTKLLDKKFDTMSKCYFINSLVNMLGLTEDDFTKFHKNKNNEDDENDEMDDDFSEDS